MEQYQIIKWKVTDTGKHVTTVLPQKYVTRRAAEHAEYCLIGSAARNYEDWHFSIMPFGAVPKCAIDQRLLSFAQYDLEC